MNAPHPSAAPSPVLQHFEGLSRTELQTLQLTRIRRQLQRVFESSLFYRDKMEQAGLHPHDIHSLDDFARLPTSNKADFLADQTDYPPYGSRLSVAPESVALINLTGGTSGQGQEIYGRTQHDIALQGYLHYLPWFLAGLRPGHTALNCVPSGGLTTGGWGPAEGFRLAGAAAINAPGPMGTDGKIDLMLRFPALHFIYTSTNYLHTLTEGLLRRGIQPAQAFPAMRGLFIAGEGYPHAWAESIVKHWGCALHEGYGSTQGAGFIASTCEKSALREDGKPGHMHLFEWENYVEIIDPESGRPVAPGEEGEIVLTNLSVLGSPVIRFATRDRARLLPAGSCGCGRAWHCIEAGSVSRYDDMMKIRGNNVWPAAVDAVMFSEPVVAEYAGRLYVDAQGRTEVEVRYAIKANTQQALDSAGLTAKLTEAIKARTNVMMNLRIVPRDQLPVFEYKARRWSDDRKSGYATQTQEGKP